MKRVKAAALAAALVFSGQAYSQQAPEKGWYLGGSLGQAETKSWCDGVTGAGCDKKDNIWRLFGGYQINRYFGVELGYADFGGVSISGPAVSANVDTTAWDLVGVASIPFGGRFAAYGKLGAYRGEVDASTTVAAFGFSRVGSASQSNNDVTYGLGLKFDITRALAVRGEWQRYLNVGGSSVGGERDIDVFNLGLMVRF
jgi:OmpA-OmpF porin, OOP family